MDSSSENLRLPRGLGRAHMIGIGGAGMSAVARLLIARGGEVSGSDIKESRSVLSLRTRGVTVQTGHSAQALDLLEGGPEVVIVSLAAIPQDNPELVEAKRRGLPILSRSQVLARLMEGYQTILVAGTHGKTSTTSMIIVALQSAGVDPSFAVGGNLNESGTNAHQGTGGVFVAEADESDGSFLQYQADIAVVTNVEPDHLDFFDTEAAYRQAFEDFLGRIRPGGSLVICMDDKGSAALARLARQRGIRVLAYGDAAHGLDDEYPLAAALLSSRPTESGIQATVLLADEHTPHALSLRLPGRHMVLNAMAALLASQAAGADVSSIIQGLNGFGGVNRRFQFHGTGGGVRVYDDYAHHPTEVRAVLTATQEMQSWEGTDDSTDCGRVVVVFQPHLYSRTMNFAQEFASALSLADEVVVLDIFGAREEPIPGVNGAVIAEKVSVPVHYERDFSKLPALIGSIVREGDILLTMGAGDVTILADSFVNYLQERSGETPLNDASRTEGTSSP